MVQDPAIPNMTDSFSQFSEPGEFPSPSIYDLSLMLSSEPGLDAWWNTVVQIMTDVYKAERVTLAVPADSTDIANVPWGQKATYNAQKDDLSLGYLARGSSFVESSNEEPSVPPPLTMETRETRRPGRPIPHSRHSFTAYEAKKGLRSSTSSVIGDHRPKVLSRSKSSHHEQPTKQDSGEADSPLFKLNQQTLAKHDELEEQQDIPTWEAHSMSMENNRGKVLDVLQALDYEADPLIDHNGVQRVLDRGRVVALTRTYPYLHSEGTPIDHESTMRDESRYGTKRAELIRPYNPPTKPQQMPGNTKKQLAPRRLQRSQAQELRKSTGTVTIASNDHKSSMPRYEEYEQPPPSPWAQSPAPSPAVRADPSENPFFTDAVVDEDTFSPSPNPHDYTAIGPLEAIGVDHSWTVLHIPLNHILLSKLHPGFKLDDTVMEQRSSMKSKMDSKVPSLGGRPPASRTPGTSQRHAPIAIISILSPLTPYPSNLRHSLEHLAPHLATSFSLCRHYTNLEIELQGLKNRRPHPTGFGAVGHDGRVLADTSALVSLGYLPAEDILSRDSLGDSITSPSDYSGLSRSTAGSPGGTPGWDPAAIGFTMDKRPSASSPAPAGGDSYFSTKAKAGLGAIGRGLTKEPREGPNYEKRSSLRLPSGQPDGLLSPAEDGEKSPDERLSSVAQELGSRKVSVSKRDHAIVVAKEAKSHDAAPPSADGRKRTAASTPTHHRQRHTQLHSYGADFAATFQSLPPSSTISSKGAAQLPTPSRSGSTSISQTEMTPPSDRLKGLILDSLPAHVFVALPQTGEIVWVNSRFLSYRGQTSKDLAADPWGSIHPNDREEYLRAWSHSVRTGEQFSRTVRIRRFDGEYRWFYARAVASRDRRGVILQFLGSYMDIHDQHIAELRAARQEEIEASEAKHRLLANLIPQIIFTATEDEGITFANEQWLSYTGQTFADALGLGFMDFVHPDDLAKCRIPINKPPQGKHQPSAHSAATSEPTGAQGADNPANMHGFHRSLSRDNTSSSNSVYGLPAANLTELARKGVVKVATDSNGRTFYTTEIRLRSKTGEYRWHLIRCVEIDVDFGNGASSYFGSATDINDHKLLEAKLKEAMDTKTRFLSNMSHEIRTPLVGISGMVSFLQDTKLNEEQRDYTNTIQTSANSLLMIINDILDLSKVDAGMMKLSYEWFHTRSLIEDVNELVSTMAIAKRLELNYIVEADVPAWVKGDKIRIRQVLLNVIGNAIKFTSQGEVFSRCSVYRSKDMLLGESEIMLEFSIIDTGRGFTEEEAELIFKPFSQIDGSSTRQHGGSGLGLVISRQLVELHGGKMDGKAVLGKGSTFTFTARFGLPTEWDHPDVPLNLSDTRTECEEFHQSLDDLQSPKSVRNTPTTSPSTGGADFASSAAESSGSSDPSLRSTGSRQTQSSSSSVSAGLVRFSAAARASGQDLSQMNLQMPQGRRSPGSRTPPEKEQTSGPPRDAKTLRPPMYSILIICPQTHSREATAQHIEMTLPKDVPHQITALSSVQEARSLVGGEDAVVFTHVVVNLPSADDIVSLMSDIHKSNMAGKVRILILCDSVQRQAVMKQVASTEYESLFCGDEVSYIYKPVKPSRFAVIFDPANERDLSIDRNRSTAERIVETQRQSYVEVEKRMGNKGYKVLLVEDNLVNQKVLHKYLKKVGVEVEVAMDGVECTDKVFSHPPGYYSLILCDLHMPRKDGYQACLEIRGWEAANRYRNMPIIALSANVMSDVQEKCIAAGFSNYVTKPIDFIELSGALSKFF
ncbi:hypothetical protein VTK73DRAFT_10013 [Phialemonium thermophilum]|uniref:histidine kinase n=1 Tax=Phialemonium thermophilum TaxID=223376 RepID=A0ABR3Y5E1_9PEZI